MNMLGADAGQPPKLCAGCNCTMEQCSTLCMWCASAGLCKECDPFTDYILQCGSVQWSSEECSGVTPTRILSQLNAKLNKLNKIESDVSEIKESITNTQDDNIFNEPSAAETAKLLVNPINRPTYAQKVVGPNPPRPYFNFQNCKDGHFSVSSDKSKKRKRSVNEIAIVQGSKTNASFQGVQPKPRLPPRRHYFISRVPQSIDTASLLDYCNEQNMKPLACRELPSRNRQLKSFHVVFPEDTTELVESTETWPANIILRRYFLNEEARNWLKTLNSESSSQPQVN